MTDSRTGAALPDLPADADEDGIQHWFRAAAKLAHPDHGGSEDLWLAVLRQRDEALARLHRGSALALPDVQSRALQKAEAREAGEQFREHRQTVAIFALSRSQQLRRILAVAALGSGLLAAVPQTDIKLLRALVQGVVADDLTGITAILDETKRQIADLDSLRDNLARGDANIKSLVGNVSAGNGSVTRLTSETGIRNEIASTDRMHRDILRATANVDTLLRDLAPYRPFQPVDGLLLARPAMANPPAGPGAYPDIAYVADVNGHTYTLDDAIKAGLCADLCDTQSPASLALRKDAAGYLRARENPPAGSPLSARWPGFRQQSLLIPDIAGEIHATDEIRGRLHDIRQAVDATVDQLTGRIDDVMNVITVAFAIAAALLAMVTAVIHFQIQAIESRLKWIDDNLRSRMRIGTVLRALFDPVPDRFTTELLAERLEAFAAMPAGAGALDRRDAALLRRLLRSVRSIDLAELIAAKGVATGLLAAEADGFDEVFRLRRA